MKDTQLMAAKAVKIKELKTQREVLSSAPINNFDVGDLQDRENVKGAIEYFSTLSQSGTTITWTMSDDTEQSVTLAELQGAADGYVLRRGQVFAQYQSLKDQVNNALTVDEVETITW